MISALVKVAPYRHDTRTRLGEGNESGANFSPTIDNGVSCRERSGTSRSARCTRARRGAGYPGGLILRVLAGGVRCPWQAGLWVGLDCVLISPDFSAEFLPNSKGEAWCRPSRRRFDATCCAAPLRRLNHATGLMIAFAACPHCSWSMRRKAAAGGLIGLFRAVMTDSDRSIVGEVSSASAKSAVWPGTPELGRTAMPSPSRA